MTWMHRPGADQHRRRHRPAARHRRAAAAGLLGWVVAHHDACSRSASCCPSRAPNRAVPRPCRRARRPCAGRWRSSPASPARAGRAHEPGAPPVGAARRGWHGRATSRRCWPWPTACAAATPTCVVTALGTAAGLEARLVPERGYPLLEVPKVPFPRRPSGDLLRLPANLRRAVRAAEDAIDSTGAEVVVGFGGYVSTPAYLAARRRGTPGRRARAERPRPAWPTGSGARFAAGVGVDLPRHAAAARHRHRDAVAPRDRDARPRRPPGRGARPVRADRRPDRARHRRVARRPAAQRGLRRRGRRRCRPPACRCCTSAGTGKEFVPDAVSRRALRRARRTATGWTSPTPPPTSWWPAPAPTRSASSPPSGCPPSTSRCRSATASSGSTPPTSSPPAEACSSTTPTSPRPGSVTSCAPLAARRRPPGHDGRGRRVGGGARRRRAARRPRRRGRSEAAAR